MNLEKRIIIERETEKTPEIERHSIFGVEMMMVFWVKTYVSASICFLHQKRAYILRKISEGVGVHECE